MNGVLLKKVVGLTLYVIELKDISDKSEKEKSQLKKRVIELERIIKR
jgi:hypothetical protein